MNSKAALEQRLAKGWAMCDAEPDPRKRERLEHHWIALLREYETMCDAEQREDTAA